MIDLSKSCEGLYWCSRESFPCFYMWIFKGTFPVLELDIVYKCVILRFVGTVWQSWRGGGKPEESQENQLMFCISQLHITKMKYLKQLTYKEKKIIWFIVLKNQVPD
jgi:hypothetical protein